MNHNGPNDLSSIFSNLQPVYVALSVLDRFLFVLSHPTGSSIRTDKKKRIEESILSGAHAAQFQAILFFIESLMKTYTSKLVYPFLSLFFCLTGVFIIIFYLDYLFLFLYITHI